MEFAKVGYYDGRNKARIAIDRGMLQACLGRRPMRVRLEGIDDAIILTDPKGPSYEHLEL